MMDWLNCFIVFIVSYLFTWAVRFIALRKSIMDIPNERSSHTAPTPRGGGLAIVLTYFGGLGYLFFHNKIDYHLFYALLSGSILAIVSLVDDLMSLKPAIRVFAQAISAFCGLLFLGGLKLFPATNNPTLFWLINGFVFVGIIWFINLYNFLDGIDAYASQEAICTALGMFFIIGNPVFIVLISAIAGFLIWNWPKAKIFMGDVGSTQLGFILVILAIHYHNTYDFNIVNWLILTSVFWFDATLTLYRRWQNKEKLSVAHKKHGYQRLNQSGYSHLRVNIIVVGLNLVLIGIVWVNLHFFHQGIIFLALTIGFLFVIMNWIDKRLPFNKIN